MADQAVYVYCFAPAGVRSAPDFPGVDGQTSVRVLDVGPVAAVYSVVSLEEFAGEAAEIRLADPAWVVPRACAHERVTESIMKGASACMPVRFGTMFASPQALAEFLAPKTAGIARFLDYISDKEEWCVKLFMDAETAAAWRLVEDPVLTAKRARMAESPGARYLQEKQLRTEARRQARQYNAALAETIQAQVQELCLDFLPLKPQDSHASGRTEEMILHGAALLSANSTMMFRDRVEELGVLYAEQGLTAETTGPWPPYHFCEAIENTPQ